ncbi:GAF domain-containing protein [Chlorobium sp. KB01]|uniref:GAF domain-containing protein n=1 Tax=Chlorobium sp. KB01 TaxID=1917528 RepID=UPI0009773E15|nr:GAF domain-containing protein [Chlorobium sp. KB01]
MSDHHREKSPIERSKASRYEQTFSKAIIDAFPGSFTVNDANGRIVWWNAYYRDVIAGLPECELEGFEALRVFHPDDRALAQEKMANILANGVEETDEGRVLLHGGPEYQWRMLSGSRIMIDGDPFVVAIGLDITERKRFEAINEFRLTLLDIAETSSVETLLRATLDEAERLTGSRLGFCHFTGNDQDALSSQVLSSNMFPKFQCVAEDVSHPPLNSPDLWSDALLNRRPVVINNNVGLRRFVPMPEGHPEIERTLVVPVIRGGTVQALLGVADKAYDYDDNDVRLVGSLADFAWDIVARKRAELSEQKIQEVLFQAQKMELIGQLAGGIAHDFNNMLGVILGNVELAMLHPALDQSLQNNLKMILKAVERSAELTTQLLAFSRKQAVMPVVLDLNTMVERMLSMLRGLVGDQITLVWIPESLTTPVKIDPVQIDLILGNLTVNSRDAIAGSGKISIETRTISVDKPACAAGHPCKLPGEYVMLVLTDTGSGIAKKDLPHIFEPFFTTKEKDQGAGMGLATVYGIVKQNKGFIDCQSEPGKGTTFNIYLPKHRGYADPDDASEPLPSESRGKETVLIVEDEPDILSLCKLMLEKKGYAVLTASTPLEAIRITSQYAEKIHVLMTDVIMPEMNGCELARKLQLIRPDIKTLYMSGYTSDIIAREGVLEEGVGFINKPFSLTALTKKVDELLSGEL